MVKQKLIGGAFWMMAALGLSAGAAQAAGAANADALGPEVPRRARVERGLGIGAHRDHHRYLAPLRVGAPGSRLPRRALTAS